MTRVVEDEFVSKPMKGGDKLLGGIEGGDGSRSTSSDNLLSSSSLRKLLSTTWRFYIRFKKVRLDIKYELKLCL